MPDSPSDKRRLAEILLGQDLDTYVGTRRDAGRSWRLIARDIYDDTDGVVDLAEQTVRNWLGENAA